MASAWLRLAIAVMLAGFVADLGCREPTVFETKLGYENNGSECGATVDGEPRPMDTAVLLVEVAPGPNCGTCRGGSCRREALACRCSPPLGVTIENLEKMMAGLRVEDVDPNESYCLTLVALEAGHGARTTGDCECQSGWLTSAGLASRGRICASTRGGVDPEVVELSVTCRDNGRNLEIADCWGTR